MSVMMETSMGTFVIDLFLEESPNASLNFLKLCKINFYKNSLFHKVQPQFMIHSGKSANAKFPSVSIFGLLDPKKPFFKQEKNIKKLSKFYVGMEKNSGSQILVNGSQFFIVTSKRSIDYLENQFTVFGEVVEGEDAIDSIDGAFLDEEGNPLEEIKILNTFILDDPFDDPLGIESLYSGIDDIKEEREDNEGANNETLDTRKRDIKSKEFTLKLLGDSIESIPPENVLFVCRLNPITRSKDLRLIFSRFGKIVN
jgi:peptidyl-prolyl cis-trans isomerase-like 4